MSDKKNEIKWFRTGFTAGGVVSVDSEQHTLKDASVIRPGEAKGHGVWIDQEFCASVVAMAAQGKSATSGLKARFGHPNMCSEALGTFLGRWKNLRLAEDGKVIGDLHLSATAAESPKGDLRKYVEEMAAKEPDHFGASIVFSVDQEAFKKHALEHGAVEKDGDFGKYLDFESFKSPDPNNLQNLPHARCSELHAADLVDDPAATDGLFSGAGGLSLAAQMTEFLDTHPEIFKALTEDPGMVDIVTRYSTEMKPFLARYMESQKAETCGVCGDCGHQQKEISGPCAKCGSNNVSEKEYKPSGPAEPGSESKGTTPAESDGMSKKIGVLESLASALRAEKEGLTGQIASLTKQTETDAATIKALTAERDELALAKKQLEDRVKAFEAGVPPVSSVPASEGKKGGSLMERARQGKK